MAVVGSAVIQMSADTAKIRKDLGKVKGMFTRMEKDVKKTGKKIRNTLDFSKLAIGFWVVARSMRRAWDFILEGAKVEQSAKAFSSIVTKMGGDVRKEFDKIKRASGGIISDADIRKQSAIAVSLGIPIERVAELMEVARLKARDMGTDITSAFEDIAKGVGRGSRLILDNLGIILKLEEANKKYAASINKTVDQLSEYDKKQAIINATTEAGAEALTRYDLSILSTIEKLQDAQSRVKDLKDEFSLLTSELIVNSIGFGMIMDVLNRLSSEGRMKAELEEIEKKLVKAKSKMDDLQNGFFNFLTSEKAVKRLQDKIDRLSKRAIELKKELFSASAAAEAVTPPPADTAAEELRKQKDLFAVTQAKFNLGKATHNLLALDNKTLKDQSGSIMANLQLYKQQLKTLGDFNKVLMEAGALEEVAALKIQTQMAQTKKSIEELIVKQMELTGSFSQGWSEAIQKWEKDLGSSFKRGEEMANSVASAMASSFDTLFFNIMQGKLTRFEDIMKSFVLSIQAELSKMLARIIAIKLITGITSIVTGAAGGGGTVTQTAPAGGGFAGPVAVAHQGGAVKYLHNGGLASNEVPAILTNDEGVLSGRGMKALDQLNDGKAPAGGGDTFVLIQANDTQSFLDALNRNRGGVVKIFSDDLRTNGASRRAIQGVL